MNRKYIGLAAIAGGIGYGLYSLFAASSKLQFGKITFKSKSVNLTGVHILLNFPITNTDKKTSLPFDGFTGALNYGTFELAKINIVDKLSITKNSTVNLTVKVDVSFLKLGAEIVSIVQSGNFLNALYINGILKSGGLNVAVKQKVL